MITPKDPMWVPVMREILDRIVRGVYPEGSALPSERELCEEFDVSRTVLRESVKVLTEKGLVTTWRGRGTIVEPAGRWRTFDPDLLAARLRYPGGEMVIRELLILRKGIEPVLAAMAAVHADDEQRAALQQSFEELERWKHDPSAYVFADGDFHNVIVRISGVSLARDLFALMAEPFNLAREGTALIPGGLEIAHLQHRLVYECVMAGDGPGANAAMYEHLESAEERLNQLRWAEHGLVLR
jgi:GntR family galactonate operon transcriptional repressor